LLLIGNPIKRKYDCTIFSGPSEKIILTVTLVNQLSHCSVPVAKVSVTPTRARTSTPPSAPRRPNARMDLPHHAETDRDTSPSADIWMGM
jgi:hypothetical protein